MHPVLLYLARTCDFPNGIECSLASSQNGHCMLKKWHACNSNFIYTTKVYIYTTVNFDLLLSSIIYHILLVCVLNFQKQSLKRQGFVFSRFRIFCSVVSLIRDHENLKWNWLFLVCKHHFALDDSLRIIQPDLTLFLIF